MTKVVLDTNVLVSALWTPAGNPAAIVGLILSDRIVPCFDYRILDEYLAVLNRPRLAFPAGQVGRLLSEITERGLSVTAVPSEIDMPDESDRKFYEVAKFCGAYLVTGNARHYPDDPCIISPACFLGTFNTGEFPSTYPCKQSSP